MLFRSTIEAIKESFVYQENMPWILACDMMLPVDDVLTKSMPLEEALMQMKSCNQEILCVMEESSNEFVGVIDSRRVNRKVSAEILRRQEIVDEKAVAVS